MEKSSLRLQRRPSFSYAAAEPHQKDPGPLLQLVDSALDSASPDTHAAPKVLHLKLGQDNRPVLTFNPNTNEQQWTERHTDRLEAQREAATLQAFKLGQFWFNNSLTNSDAQHAARALFELAKDNGVRADGLPCTNQLRGLLATLNEAHKARDALPPQLTASQTQRVSHFRLPSLSPRKLNSSPPTTLHSKQDSHRRSPSTPRNPTTASRDSETDTSTSSKRDDSPTKNLSPRKAPLKKQPMSDLSKVRAAVRHQKQLGDLQDLFFPEDDNTQQTPRVPMGKLPNLPAATPPVEPLTHSSFHDAGEPSTRELDLPLLTVTEGGPSIDTPSEESSPKTPASDRPTPSEKARESDDVQTRARSMSTRPARRQLGAQPRPSRLKAPGALVTPTPEHLPPSASEDQAPPTDTH